MRDSLRDEITFALIEVYAGKDFNPNQPRDPHTGEWIDVPGVDVEKLGSIFGDQLVVGSGDNAKTHSYLAALEQVPDGALMKLKRGGISVHVDGSRTLGEMGVDDTEFGNAMAGVFSSVKQVVAAGGRGDGDHTLWHEIGHFFGHSGGIDNSPELEKWRAELTGQMPFSHPFRMPGGSGNKEFWADAYADYIEGGKEKIIKRWMIYGASREQAAAFADWVAGHADRFGTMRD